MAVQAMSLRISGNPLRWSQTMRIGALLLLLASVAAVAQVPTPIRSVATLPATCRGGNSFQESDAVMLITAGVGQQYNCTSTNVWTAVAAGGIPTGVNNGSQLTSNGVNQAPVYQPKPIFDVRDYGLKCDGSTNDTGAFGTLLTAVGSNQATIAVPLDATHPGPCLMSSVNLPANVTLDFSSGGSISLIANTTSPGNAVFVQGAGTSNSSPTSSCSVTLSGTTAGNTIVFLMEQQFNAGNVPNAPVDGKNLYAAAFASNALYAESDYAWIATDVTGGNVAITATLNGPAKTNACQAHEYSGLGPAIKIDGSSWGAAISSTLTMDSS